MIPLEMYFRYNHARHIAHIRALAADDEEKVPHNTTTTNASEQGSCFSSLGTNDIQCTAFLPDLGSTNSTKGLKAARSCCEATFGGNFTYIPSCGFHCSTTSESYLQKNRTSTSSIITSIIEGDWLKCARSGTNETLQRGDATCNIQRGNQTVGVQYEDSVALNVGVIVLVVVAVAIIAFILLCWWFRNSPWLSKIFKKIKSTFLACSEFRRH